jgi:hypothetical protein
VSIRENWSLAGCLVLGWRVCDWPLPINSNPWQWQRMRKDKRVQGPSVSVAERRIQSPRLIYRMQKSQPFSRKGRWQMLGATSPLHPFPPFRAAWAKTHYPPPQSRPLPQENYHLGLTSVKTSFWPPNLDQKSWFGHKTTDWSRSS